MVTNTLRVNSEDILYGRIIDGVHHNDGFIYYKNSLFTGILYESGPLGNILFEESIVNGKKEGYWRKRNEHGTLHREIFYKKDIVYGTSRVWHPNGQIASENRFIDTGELFLKEWDSEGFLYLHKQSLAKTGHVFNIHSFIQKWNKKKGTYIEILYEYRILVERKEWDSEGNMTAQFNINPEEDDYTLLQKRRKRHNTPLSFKISQTPQKNQ